MTTKLQLCTFVLNRHHFGVDVQNVQEVIRYQDMTPVPLASAVVSGLINLRGQIVTAIDLRLRLGLPEREPGQRPMNVVVRTDDGPVSLLVDDIGDVIEVSQDDFEDPPHTLNGTTRGLVRGTYKLRDRLMLTLDMKQVLSFPAFAAG